jgi:hypothetical protein
LYSLSNIVNKAVTTKIVVESSPRKLILSNSLRCVYRQVAIQRALAGSSGKSSSSKAASLLFLPAQGGDRGCHDIGDDNMDPLALLMPLLTNLAGSAGLGGSFASLLGVMGQATGAEIAFAEASTILTAEQKMAQMTHG